VRIAAPSATRSPPETQAFSGPREYSSGALTRCPPGDQPGAGGKVRGITGPSSSAQITVEPAGGAVQSSTMRVLSVPTPGRRSPTGCGSAARAPARPDVSAAPG